MDPARFDLIHHADSMSQLPLQGALVVNPLHEGSHAHPLLIEQFKPDDGASAQSAGGKSKPVLGYLVHRYVDGRPAR